MSYHWENVIWQSRSGSWNRGYFTRLQAGNHWDEDYDSEWHDDFDRNGFDYLITGCASQEEAERFEPHGNPGSSETYPYRGNSKECKAFDAMAAFHVLSPEEKKAHLRREQLRANRQHFKALAAQWTPETLSKLGHVRVIFKEDGRAHDYFGMQSIASGCVRTDGDWLTMEGHRLFNTKTGKFDSKVHSVNEDNPSRSVGYRPRW